MVVANAGLARDFLPPISRCGRNGVVAVLAPPKGATEYADYCAECHGSDGKKIIAADLTNAELITSYGRSFTLIAALKRK